MAREMMNTVIPISSSINGGADGVVGGFSSNPMDMINSSFLLQRVPMMTSTSVTTVSQTPEEKALAACKSHKEAERLRRKRINGHLSTLRTLLPNLLKNDKASLLAEVVRRVRELKQATSQLTASPSSDVREEERLLPEETDGVRLRRCDGGVVVATLSCEDRPDLLSDLSRALKTVKVKIVRAEIATVGGRTKSVLWLQEGVPGREGLGALSRALKVVVDRPHCSGPFGPGLGLLGSKRQRLYL